MTEEMRIRSAEEYLLHHLVEVGHPVSTEELDAWRRSNNLPVTPSDV